MEGANEAARRSVNELLQAAGSASPRCMVAPLQEPTLFLLFKAIDQIRFDLGLPAYEFDEMVGVFGL
jgi:hypothetical protein